MAHHLRFFISKKDSLVIGLVFSFNSLLFGNWVTRIPSIKDALGLSEAELGLALVGAPVGALIIMPFSGWLIARFSVGKTVWVSSVILSISLVLLALADTFWALTLALFFFGFNNSVMDISMNAAAAVTERNLKRPIMSTCHGMWSVGAMVGSGIGSLLVGFELSTLAHLAGTAMVMILLLIFFRKHIMSYQETRRVGDKVFAIPNLTLFLLALMGFCIMVSEGGIADWSAVYMKDTLKANAFLTGIAYAGFSLLMAIGRMMGDAIIPRFGKQRVVMWGGFLAAFGLAFALLFGTPVMAIIGFSIAGFGYSCVVPVLFMSAANEPGYSSGTGIAAVTTVGYAGFLAGPPLIGFLAEAYGLSIGLSFIVLCSLLVSFLSFTVKFK